MINPIYRKYETGAHRLFVETYSEAALSNSCRERFQKFKNG